MEDSDDDSCEEAIEDNLANDGRISNELEEPEVVKLFNMAVSNSSLNQKQALQGALDNAFTTEEVNDMDLPVLKPEVVESYEDYE